MYVIMCKNINKKYKTFFIMISLKLKMLTCDNLFADCVPDEHKPKQTK